MTRRFVTFALSTTVVVALSAQRAPADPTPLRDDIQVNRIAMRLRHRKASLVIDLEGVAFGIQGIHPKSIAVTDGALDGHPFLVEHAVELFEFGQGVHLER